MSKVNQVRLMLVIVFVTLLVANWFSWRRIAHVERRFDHMLFRFGLNPKDYQ